MSQGLPVMSSNSTALQDHLDETRVPQALVVLSLCPAIALGCVALQLYTRAFVLRRVFWEDYSIVAAMVGLAFPHGSTDPQPPGRARREL
jgi:hypothetical protein